MISTFSASSIKTSFIWFINFMKGTQFLNVTKIPAPSTLTGISPVTRI